MAFFSDYEVAVDPTGYGDVAVYSAGNRMASYKVVERGIYEVSFLDDDNYHIGHINQLEKAEGVCLHWLEEGTIPVSWYRVAEQDTPNVYRGRCCCHVCKRVREERADAEFDY